MSKNIKKILKYTLIAGSVAFVGLNVVAKKKKKDSIYADEIEQKNVFEGRKVMFVEDQNDNINADGARGHLVEIGEISCKFSFYEKYVKRGIDIFLSFGALIVLSPIMGVITLAIKIEDPGPAIFTQKRIGQNKQFFKLHKFRSMKISAPHDVPTHMLDNPDQYITKVGKFLRLHSLDELPQIWDIFIGNMSIIGPRPSLWNQDVLIAERDKYGANNIKPGLTGWAQINGRDELEISEKAMLDGEYCKNIGFKMDIKVLFKSFSVLNGDDSVVEGSTNKRKKIGRNYTNGKSKEELIGHIGFGEPVEIDLKTQKKVLITGAGSYIGESFRQYAKNHYSALVIDELDLLNSSWKARDFSKYDIIYHVAGIAHSDVGIADNNTKKMYYAVNTDLAVEVCKKAKSEGVKEFVFMSSMIVYGDSYSYRKMRIVDKDTIPSSSNFYGDSKLQADVAVRELSTDKFKVIVLRPPMVYGSGSKGNYQKMFNIAKKTPLFPRVDNKRSMIHIDNLCEFLCQVMLIKDVKLNSIVLMPQNSEWANTSEIVEIIANDNGNKIKLCRPLKHVVTVLSKAPGKTGKLVNKAFGNLVYDHEMSIYSGIDYQKISMKESFKKRL